MTAASEDVILLDDTLTETFLTDLQSRGRTEETLKCYRNSLGKLCGFLPGRRLSHEAMRRWPESCARAGLLSEYHQQRGLRGQQPARLLRAARLAGHARPPARDRAARADARGISASAPDRTHPRKGTRLPACQAARHDRTSRASARCGHGKRRAGRRSAGI